MTTLQHTAATGASEPCVHIWGATVRKLIVLSAAVVAVSAPVTASYAGNPHGGGGGGGGKTPPFTFSVPATDTVDQSLVPAATVTVTRSGATPTSISSCSSTVKFSTSNGTGPGAAVAGTDYTAVTGGTVTFNPGDLTASATVPLIHESDHAPDADGAETFTVTITSATTACKGSKSTIATGAATDVVSINDSRTVVHVPAGVEVQVHNPTYAGCANLDASLIVGNAAAGLGGIAGGCVTANHKNDQHISPDTTDRVATVALLDSGCGVTYSSDTTSAPGTSVNHALMTPVSTGVWDFALADGGGGGAQCGTFRIPSGSDGFNFTGRLMLVSSKPATPANFAVTQDPTFGIDLHWDASPTADAYDIYRGADPSSMGYYTQWNATPFTDTSMNSGDQYCYAVVATNDFGGSTATSTFCATSL